MHAHSTTSRSNLSHDIKPSLLYQLASHLASLALLSEEGVVSRLLYRCAPFIPGSHVSPSPDVLPRGVRM